MRVPLIGWCLGPRGGRGECGGGEGGRGGRGDVEKVDVLAGHSVEREGVVGRVAEGGIVRVRGGGGSRQVRAKAGDVVRGGVLL